MKIKILIFLAILILVRESFCGMLKSIVLPQKNISELTRRPNQRLVSKHDCRLTFLVENSFSEKNLPHWCRVISRSGNIVSVVCHDTAFSMLDSIPGIKYIKYPEDIEFQMDTVRVLTHTNEIHGTRPSNLTKNLTGKGVLFGIIDSDFDIYHPAFLNSDGQTRFVALWDQTDTTASSKNNRYGFGAIKTGESLKLDSSMGLSDQSTHGTLMTSFAAGSDYANNYYGIAPDVVIAAVRSSYKDNDIILGLDWLNSIADSLNMPCVINLSLGSRNGPHDGTSLTDQKIDAICGPGRIVVGAVGNDFAIAPHTKFTFSGEESWGTWVRSVYDKPRYYSYLEIWGDKGLSISPILQFVNSLDSTVVYEKEIPLSSKGKYKLEDAIVLSDFEQDKKDTIYFIVTGEKASSLNGKPYLSIKTNSTTENMLTGVKIKANSGTVHVWNVYRKGLTSCGLTGYKGADGLYTVCETGGTAKRIITVGAYIGRTFVKTWDNVIVSRGDNYGKLAHFSASGPTADGRVKPEITAPGWSVIGAINRLVDGVESDEGVAVWSEFPDKRGRYASNTGTSASSPIVAGIVALMLQADPELTPETIRELIQNAAITDEFTGKITEPVNRWGAGKVNALGTIKKLLGIPETIVVSKKINGQKTFIKHLKNGIKIQHLQQGTISLYDLSGRRVLCKNVKNGDIVSLNRINSGVYTISVEHKNGKFRSKIYIQ